MNNHTNMNNHTKVLNELVDYIIPIHEIKIKVRNLNWDYDGTPVIIRCTHIKRVLDRFINGELNKDEIEEWANLIECREDLDFDINCADKLSEIIYKLANPVLEGEFDLKMCHDFLKLIENCK